jgi:hypothetical protein
MPLSPDLMRHIPEEELHACLDQALSRSQCVEIEHHLAECRMCRAERDAIAALRDRTTALLVAAAPRRIRPRPYAQLSATHVKRVSRHTQRLRAAAWAASVVAAVGLGWGLSHWAGSALPSAPQLGAVGAPIQAAPLRASAPVRLAAAPARASRRSPAPRPERTADATAPVPPRPAASELASVGGTSTGREPVLEGVWRNVSWTNTQTERDDWVPRVEGVPVVQVKVRQAPQGGRPITLVTQLLANGEMISTVEGPAQEVATLLAQQPGQSASAELQDMQAAPATMDPSGARPAAAAMNRTLAIFGSAPSDSLKAFMLRVK